MNHKITARIGIGWAVFITLALTAWLAAGGPSAREIIPSLFQESYILESKGKHKAALKKAREVLKRDPNEYVAQLRVGWLLYLDEEYTESVIAYRKVVAMKPSAIEPKLGLMLPLMALKKNSEATGVAQEILKVDPQNYLARSRMAFCLYLMGRYEKAGREYEKLLVLYPSDVEMMAGLGWSQLKMDKKEAARSTFARLLHIAPNHVIGKDGFSRCK